MVQVFILLIHKNLAQAHTKGPPNSLYPIIQKYFIRKIYINLRLPSNLIFLSIVVLIVALTRLSSNTGDNKDRSEKEPRIGRNQIPSSLVNKPWQLFEKDEFQIIYLKDVQCEWKNSKLFVCSFTILSTLHIND
ncbi:unnamed protein product [Paramecium sonneborni]|uniref:Uncharacterized protein n=1 Tax=Paramecium sonneborni TaxID=65129 RepID=A0A8S1QFC1_9CILI|nr:unnamed protein product [Paramecium sonneborni]